MHLPLLPSWPQASHWPEQRLSQHTPSTQKVDMQVDPLEQTAPFGSSVAPVSGTPASTLGPGGVSRGTSLPGTSGASLPCTSDAPASPPNENSESIGASLAVGASTIKTAVSALESTASSAST